jgi:hypothetical protein
MILKCDLHPKKIREIFLVYFEILYVVGSHMVAYKFCMVPTNLVRYISVISEGFFYFFICMKIFFFNSNINIPYHLGNFKINYIILKNVEMLKLLFLNNKNVWRKCLYLQEYYVSPNENLKINQLFDIHYVKISKYNKTFALCNNVNGGHLICCNHAWTTMMHLKKWSGCFAFWNVHIFFNF